MSCFKKLGLILWKNLLFRRRHFIMTALEIIFPTLFAVTIYMLRKTARIDQVVYQSQFTEYQPVDLTSSPMFYVMNNNPSYLLYYPNTSVALDLLYYVNNYTSLNLNFEGIDNESDINSRVQKMKRIGKNILGAVVFEGLKNDEENELFDEKLKYKIRLHWPWFTDRHEIIDDSPGPPDESVYRTRVSFIVLQHAIAIRIIEIKSGKSNLLNNYWVTTEPFPFPPYFNDTGFSMLMRYILPLFITLSYIFTAPITVRRIVREKETGIKELMKLMGIPTWIQWFGWFFSSFIMMALSAVIIVALLCVKSQFGTAALDQSAPELVYVILLFYIVSAICFCFFITSLFSKPTIAAGVTVLVWLLSFCVPYYSLLERYRSLQYSHKMALSLIPNMAMAWAIKIIAGFEAQLDGIQWNNLNQPTRGDDFTMFDVLFMMIVDTFLYSLLTWYIDNVHPGVYGVPKQWYFLFTKAYWTRGTMRIHVTNDVINYKDKDKFEEEPMGLTSCIVIKNLFKSYGYSDSSVLAVNNLSLNMYEGQITALLGHNGAGKTTTMSILTGMFPPSKGTAFINGCDIRTEIDKARKDLGLCPQHNMLFDSLTVKEHLEFFGKLKMDSTHDLKIEVTELLKKLQLYDIKNTFPANLSGGMKRKLNLGIALIGRPKVVMLDEPTSGMDPEARREIWDLLKELKIGRCILLSTHFMEEADVLGDRIAIMARGQVECCGSALFLKKQYGAGYHLMISLELDSHVNEITNIINSHISSSYLKSNNELELCYILPSDETAIFPRLFEKLEVNSEFLGIKSFALSVTTMEEVFLKVGEKIETENEDEEIERNSKVAGLEYENDVKIVYKNTGISLKFQQFYGLLLKRFYYTRHRYILITIQLLLPIFTILIFLYVSNALMHSFDDDDEPPRLLDLSPYKHCVSFVHQEPENDVNMSKYYRSSFPSRCSVRNEKNPVAYLKETAVNDFSFFRDQILFGAAFHQKNEYYFIQIWFNGHYYHTLPTVLNLVHNALLKNNTGNEKLSISVINEPMLSNKELYNNDYFGSPSKVNATVTSILMGIFVPVGLSMLAASFVVLPIHERITKCKHIQFMSGVGGTLFWIASFICDFIMCSISSCIAIILFASFDNTNIFNADNFAIIFLILLLHGWASIPFTYLFSFFFRLPATGFTTISIVNISTGIILSIWQFLNESAGKSSDWKWLWSLVPNYVGSIAFMKLVLISNSNNACINTSNSVCHNFLHLRSEKSLYLLQCCPGICGNYCFKKKEYFVWDWPGLGSEVIMLALDGVFYLLIIIFIESSYFYKICHLFNQVFLRIKRRNKNVTNSVNTVDSDVLEERERIHNITCQDSSIRSDYLLVRDLTKYFGNLTAVNELNFGVENGVCFGLLGINGAGKTTTFRQLTRDLFIDSGEAFVQEFSITRNQNKYLSNIGYCPQFNALNDYLTGKEILNVFANLYGIVKSQIKNTIDKIIIDFDLTNHANKLILVYSGGNKRKLSTALAFVGQPAVVFLDEPTTGVDPMARRKIWNMIKETNKTGTAIVLTSHSMEECEVLCSRVGIMVNGQFDCLGGIQYLKNKFSQGYTILAKLKQQSTPGGHVENNENQNELQRFIEMKFPTATLKDVHQGLVHYQVKDPNTKLTELFVTMETAKERFDLEDYSVTQATLEQVFLSFARKQRVIQNEI